MDGASQNRGETEQSHLRQVLLISINVDDAVKLLFLFPLFIQEGIGYSNVLSFFM